MHKISLIHFENSLTLVLLTKNPLLLFTCQSISDVLFVSTGNPYLKASNTLVGYPELLTLFISLAKTTIFDFLIIKLANSIYPKNK